MVIFAVPNCFTGLPYDRYMSAQVPFIKQIEPEKPLCANFVKIWPKKMPEQHYVRAFFALDRRQCDDANSSALGQHLVDQTVFRGGLGRHEIVAIGVLADLLDATAGLLSEDGVQTFTQVQDFTCLDLDI